MSTSETFVIVGAGMAGAKAAETLREEGFDGRVVLLGEEDVRPYERPPLSKDYLRGEAEESSIYVHDPGFYDSHDVELRTGARVVELAPQASEVELAGGERIRYDSLLLATGSSARRIPVPGIDLDGVHLLRTVGDSERLRAALGSARRLVVVGAGWIGAEVAASARQMGVEVAMVAPEAVPLERVLGPELGAIYRDVHAAHGVELALGTGVEAIEGSGRATGVRTSDGRLLEADLVVVGAGAAPRVELAEAAGLRVEGGVLCDDRLRTSVPNVFAAGDIASAQHPLIGTRVRVEHWANALEQGPAAARNMLGRDVAYDRVPYFFSDQYDVGMEYAGYATGSERVVFRGDPAGMEFIAFWLRGAQVVAGMNVNVWDVTDDIQALIRGGGDVDEDSLRDPSRPLAEVSRQAF
jgi:3-phenylpropionate/trans-cinnamate dioxygenase ferredoxin reductase component